MRKLITAPITDSAQFPVKSGTLDHLQLAYQEALAALANNLVGRTVNTNGYRLFGCVNSGSGSTFTISAGAVYYNGEVYLVDAVTFTAGAGQTAVAQFVTSYYTTNADPVTFTDGVGRNVHEVKKITFASANSGTGLFNFADLRETGMGLKRVVQPTLGATYVVTFEQDKVVYFEAANVDTELQWNFTDAVPGTVVRLKWTYGASRVLTVAEPSGAVIIREAGSLANVDNSSNVIYALYVGLNDDGDHEVSYTLKQI